MDTQYKNRMVVLLFLVVIPISVAASYFVSGVFDIPSPYDAMFQHIFAIIPTMIMLLFMQVFGKGQMGKNQRTMLKSMILGFCFSATFWLYIQGAFDKLYLGLVIVWIEVYLIIIIIVMYILIKSKAKTIDKWFDNSK